MYNEEVTEIRQEEPRNNEQENVQEEQREDLQQELLEEQQEDEPPKRTSSGKCIDLTFFLKSSKVFTINQENNSYSCFFLVLLFSSMLSLY